jgi:aminodeoxyfutalosine deaminase
MGQRGQATIAALISPMIPALLPKTIAPLPKAELHLHLEGSIQPATVRALTARRGLEVSEEDIRRRYAYRDFSEFIEAFKWVTSYLYEPKDYALIARDLAERLLSQGVVYAEVSLSIGVMLLRKQVPEANFEAILRETELFAGRGLRLQWIFDATRQFGAEAAMRVVDAARTCGSKAIVAFGIGGDEMSVETREFRPVYDKAAEMGLHKLMHGGEIGGPDKIREAIELLGAERIGHGIAAIHDPGLMDLLAQQSIPLEICPASNVKTGALALQLRRTTATIQDHPLPRLYRHGIPVVLSTDDPAMFHTTLIEEYDNARRMGLTINELAHVAAMSFEHAFLSETEKRALVHGRKS